MINTKLYEVLSRELVEAQTSNNPELIERLNLASIILDKKFISSDCLVDYLKWTDENGSLTSAAMQLFSKYIFTKRASSDEIGIYPFLMSLFVQIEEIIDLGEFPELKNPQDRIQQIKGQLSIIESQIEDYNNKLLDLTEHKSKLDSSYKDLLALEQKYSTQMSELEELDKLHKELEVRLQRFQSDYSLETIANLKAQYEELQTDYLKAQETFKKDEDIEKYYKCLHLLVEEHDALKKLSEYRRVLTEIFEDLSITQNIISKVEVNTAALEGAASKLSPYYEELKKELKEVVESLTKI